MDKQQVNTGLPIHVSDEENKVTFCGIKIIAGMSYHRGGFWFREHRKDQLCPNCLKMYDYSKRKISRRWRYLRSKGR